MANAAVNEHTQYSIHNRIYTRELTQWGEDILLQAEEAYKAMEKEAAEATATMQKDRRQSASGF